MKIGMQIDKSQAVEKSSAACLPVREYYKVDKTLKVLRRKKLRRNELKKSFFNELLYNSWLKK